MSMNRPIALVGAPSSIGIRPYDNGEARHLDRAPAVLRELRVVERLGAVDLGDVVPPPYRDFVRSPGRVRNEPEVAAYCEALGERIAAATADRRFAVVRGGDCSIVLRGLLGARQTAGGSVGLAYFDAHADFGSPEESRTGSAASMCLALAVGRGESRLARLAQEEPLTRPERFISTRTYSIRRSCRRSILRNPKDCNRRSSSSCSRLYSTTPVLWVWS